MMGYNARYWGNKGECAKEAVIHTKLMEDLYKCAIQSAIENTIEYTDKVEDYEKELGFPRNTIVDMDSVSAIFKYKKEGKICVLNFASYRNPGGKFIEGSKAQEESLCHASILYNVLKEFSNYYAYNEKHREYGLYTNRALYTPNVLFMNNNENLSDLADSLYCDVLTCAAPNKSALMYYDNFTVEEKESKNRSALLSRIEFIKKIVEVNNVDTLILGAYGCGVFRQNAEQVAQIFKNVFEKTSVKEIIYAIPSGMDKSNYNAFIKIFSGK